MSKDVTILTGFLGAGKTTFLNSLLIANNNRKCAIIENEIGEIGVDGELIIKQKDQLIEMNNGCLCCTLNDNLQEILLELLQKKNDFDELIIEATGIADPAAIAEPFKIFPAIKKEFDLKRVICLVDGEYFETQAKENDEVIKQISFSDIIIINKIDLIGIEKSQQLMRSLSSINPFAKIFVGSKTKYPISEIFSLNNSDFNNIHKCDDKKCSCSSKNKHSHNHLSKITTLSFAFDEPFNETELFHRMMVLLLAQSDNIYRVKGILYLDKNPKKIILQSVRKRLNVEEGDYWQDNEKLQSKLVFIGKELNKDSYEKILTKLLSIKK